MIPLKDENPTQRFPFITLLFILLNIAVFFYGNSLPFDLSALYSNYALVPIKLLNRPLEVYPTIYTSMFLHAGIWHLGGNMLYLWIFGNNIEDVLGKLRFVLFYFLCGTLAAFGHITTDLDSKIPMVGASGAISGILGAYLILFPFAKIRTLYFLGFSGPSPVFPQSFYCSSGLLYKSGIALLLQQVQQLGLLTLADS